MNTLPPEQLVQHLQWRYATKKFDPSARIPAPVWAALEQSLVLAPSSFGLQPWKFLVIDDPALRAQLEPKSWGQKQITDASHMVVFTVRIGLDEAHVDRFLDSQVAIRGGTREALAGYRGMILNSLNGARTAGRLDTWQTHQVYIALGQFMTAAALLGVDACPLEGIEPAAYDSFLGLEGTGYRTVVVCTAGYRAADDKYASLPKVRFPADEVVRHV
jgi:nitroreductase